MIDLLGLYGSIKFQVDDCPALGDDIFLIVEFLL
jgi:hypothetical protein